MTKIVFLLFTALTLGTGYLSYHNVGAEEASNNDVNRSVRSGSVGGRRVSYGGGK